MKSIIEDALSRNGVVTATNSKAKTNLNTESTTKEPIGISDMQVDEQLQEMLAKLKTNIKIIGSGGGGCNTIARLVEEGILGADLIAANTDAQHLRSTNVPQKILLGRRTTRGLGAGAIPQIGEEATREADEEIRQALANADAVFITCGLGGGTGTGAGGIVSGIAKEMGALTIAIATTPFRGEGKLRKENADWGLERLRSNADTVITIPNDRLLEVVPRLPLNAAFRVADEVLMHSIKGLTEIVTKPGLVNLDFNDLKTIMKNGGVAMIGLGESDAHGDDRAVEAIEDAINSPLLDVDISRANAVLVNVTGGNDMTVTEAEKVAEIVQKKVSPNARIIWGANVDPTLDGVLKVMLVVTGVESKQIYGKISDAEKSGVGVDIIQ